jgi:hypothetical protein
MPTASPLSLNSTITTEGYSAAANNVADANGFKINLTKVKPVVNGMPQGEFPAVGVALGNGQVRIRATLDSAGVEYGFDEVWIYDGNSNVVFCKVKRSDGGILDYVSPYKSSVINYTIRFTTLPAGTVTIVADSGQSLALAALDAHFDSDNPHPNAPYARYHDVGANNNLLTNGGMDIWQENTNFIIPKVTLPYTADCYVVHGGDATDTGSVNVVMARWQTSPSHYGAITRGIDDDLPRGVDRFMALYRGGAGLVSIQNRSLQNYYTYAGRRVVFSLYARIAGYNGHAYNVTEDLPEQGPTLTCHLGVQRVVSHTGTGSVTKTAQITPYWKLIYVVLDIPAPDETRFPLSIPKERSYAEVFFQIHSAASIEIHTTAWKVEDCLYPSDFPIENIKPSPWLPKLFSAELMECQRYYCKSYPTYVPVGTPFADQFQASGFKRTMNDMGDQMINATSTQFPMEMISKPAITIYNCVTGVANNAGLVTSGATPNFNVAGIEWGVKGIHGMAFSGYTSNIALEFHYSATHAIDIYPSQ